MKNSIKLNHEKGLIIMDAHIDFCSDDFGC